MFSSVQAALSAQLTEQSAALAAARQRAEAARAASVESERKVGVLEIKLQVCIAPLHAPSRTWHVYIDRREGISSSFAFC